MQTAHEFAECGSEAESAWLSPYLILVVFLHQASLSAYCIPHMSVSSRGERSESRTKKLVN